MTTVMLNVPSLTQIKLHFFLNSRLRVCGSGRFLGRHDVKSASPTERQRQTLFKK